MLSAAFARAIGFGNERELNETVSTNGEVPMPELRFQIEWPDGTQAVCYSPSLVVKQYFAPDQSYSQYLS
ncbi:hypothetical protein [Altericista sp. CCNU0014]|uniref:hypothetical protein n=1 Tax=Altericista sp. CCNU0014 TaxID=3082949 RepID=UPI00384AEB13